MSSQKLLTTNQYIWLENNPLTYFEIIKMHFVNYKAIVNTVLFMKIMIRMMALKQGFSTPALLTFFCWIILCCEGEGELSYAL